MQEILAQLYSYARGIWRHRWLALVLTWVVALAGWVSVAQMPDAYVASARIYVDTNSVLRPLLKGLTVQPNINQRIDMMSRTLLSRPNLEKLMRMTDLDLEFETDEQKEKLQLKLSESITLTGDRRNASLYTISVLNHDRDMARRIAQSLITIFIESSLTGKREDSSDAQDFLDAQITDYEKRLIEAEDRLARFKQENMDVLSGGGDYYTRLQNVNQNLAQARLDLREAQNRREELQRQVDGEDPVFISSSVTGSEVMSPLDMRIQTLRVELDSLKSQYTDRHPEVRQIKALIAELEAEKAAEYERLRADAGNGYAGISNSPVYQEMRTMLAETEAIEAQLSVRVAEFENRKAFLNSKVLNIPEIEAQLKQLDRDYQVVTAQHRELLTRREAASLSRDVEQNANDLAFRVIDPPFVPLEPSEPNKPLLNAGVLVLAIGSGLGVAFLLSLVRPVVGDARSLAHISGLPLLGTISLKQGVQEARREFYSQLILASFSAVLVLTYLGLSFGPRLIGS